MKSNRVTYHFSVLTSSDARIHCTRFGAEWGVDKETSGSIVCTRNGVRWNSNCNSCDTWRLIVFKSGSDEYGTGSMSTAAGSYYGGHSPCTGGDNFPLCGYWPNSRRDDAIDQCKAFGNEWGVDKETIVGTSGQYEAMKGAIVCTKNGVGWTSNCDSCATWRLMVFESGYDEYGGVYGSKSTTAGSYYGGHSPCKAGDNFPLCGYWSNGNLKAIY